MSIRQKNKNWWRNKLFTKQKQLAASQDMVVNESNHLHLQESKALNHDIYKIALPAGTLAKLFR